MAGNVLRSTELSEAILVPSIHTELSKKEFVPQNHTASYGPEVIKLFSCSTQLSMKFFPLIDVKMPTIVGILTCMSGKNNILGLTEP